MAQGYQPGPLLERRRLRHLGGLSSRAVPAEAKTRSSRTNKPRAPCLVFSKARTCGRCRLFSLRKRGKRVATLEVGYSSDTGALKIAQLKGPGNRKATTAGRKIADQWLTAQAERPNWRPMAVRGDGNFDTDIAAYRTVFEVEGKPRSIPSLSLLAFGLQELEHHLDTGSKH